MDNARRRVCLGLVAAAAVAVSACGQKGRLYFPEDSLEEAKKKRRPDVSTKQDG